MWWALLVASAWAEPYRWKWPSDQTARYVLEMKTQAPYVMWLLQERNAEVRVSFVALQAVIECAPQEALPKDRGWSIRCPIRDASFFAMPLVEDAGRAQPVVEEYERLLEKATIEFKHSPDGRVSSVRLLGIAGHEARTTYIVTQLERYVERAMSALDVQLPEVDPPPAEWKQRPFLAAEMPISEVATGSVRATQSIGAREGDVQVFDGAADGALVVGGDNWKVSCRSQAAFDVVRGRMTRGVVEVGSQAASATIGANTLPFRLSATITEVDADLVVELAPSTGF